MKSTLEELELDWWCRAGITGNQISKLAENITTDLETDQWKKQQKTVSYFDHILVTCWRFQGFEHSFGSIALDIFSISDDLKKVLFCFLEIAEYLNNAMPNFVRNIVTGNSDELKDNVNIPVVICSILLTQNSRF